MITRLHRTEFLSDYFPHTYNEGEHLLIIGPTGRAGKTTLAFQLLEAANHPGITPVVFCMKPKDETVGRFTTQQGFREISSWPPQKKWFQEKPPGYTLWPHQSLTDADKDNENIKAQFKKGMMGNYAKGNCILFLDEVYGITADLGLNTELNAILTRGRSMGCGAWMATQKPSGTTGFPLPGFVFNSPTHMFLAYDNVKANREKYADLAGNFDPREIEATVLGLSRYEFLYLHADGDKAIIGQ